MSRKSQIALIIPILLLAAVLRLTNLDWDDYNNFHPDESYISWVATTIEWPDNWRNAFQPQESSFNPFYWPKDAESKGIVVEQDQPRRFAYGHLPLYMGVAATRLMERGSAVLSSIFPSNWSITDKALKLTQQIEYRSITATGRSLTALLDIATVGLVFVLGRSLFGPATGLLAATFLALNVMHIQLAHFFTVDPFLAFFVVTALMFMILSSKGDQKPKTRSIYLLLASISSGLAVGAKFSGIMLLLPLALTVMMDVERGFKWRLVRLSAAAFVAFLAFTLTNPFAILDLSCQALTPAIQFGPFHIPSLSWRSCYLENVVSQGTMVRGLRDVPFVRQYEGTLPFLYYIEMQLRWGMGLFLGIVAFGGLAWAIWRAYHAISAWWRARKEKQEKQFPESLQIDLGRYSFAPAELIILSWTLPFFLTTGALNVKFMRYLAPLTPFLMIYGAAMLLSWSRVKLRRLAIGLVLLSSLLYALSFTNMYNQFHPWEAASRWIYANIESGTYIYGESWDYSLPANLEIDGVSHTNTIFNMGEVNWLSGTETDDNLAKLERNLAQIAGADYLVISSNRNYGVIPRLEERYPLSKKYYPLLFNGQLGYEVAYASTRMPNLAGIYLKPDAFTWAGIEAPEVVSSLFAGLPGLNLGRFDESFTVYDQPLVIIFANTGRLTAEEMVERFIDS